MRWGTRLSLLAAFALAAEVVARLNGEIGKIVGSASLRERLSTQGIEPRASTAGEFGAHLKSEIEKWRRVVKVASIKLE